MLKVYKYYNTTERIQHLLSIESHDPDEDLEAARSRLGSRNIGLIYIVDEKEDMIYMFPDGIPKRPSRRMIIGFPYTHFLQILYFDLEADHELDKLGQVQEQYIKATKDLKRQTNICNKLELINNKIKPRERNVEKDRLQ